MEKELKEVGVCVCVRRSFGDACWAWRWATPWAIQENYGPNGLLGYDLANGYADVTSYTQLAAFTCNGLLIALTRGQMMGKMAPLVKYVGLSSREWMASQRPWERKERTSTVRISAAATAWIPG